MGGEESLFQKICEQNLLDFDPNDNSLYDDIDSIDLDSPAPRKSGINLEKTKIVEKKNEEPEEEDIELVIDSSRAIDAHEAEVKAREAERLAEENRLEQERIARESEEKRKEDEKLAREAEEKRAEDERLAKEAEIKAEEERLAREAEERRLNEEKLAQEKRLEEEK